MPASPMNGVDWPAIQFIAQILGFIAAIIAIMIATHKVTKKITSDFLILDGEIKVLKEAANNMKTHIDKLEERITYMERLKMADSSSDTAKDLLKKMGE